MAALFRSRKFQIFVNNILHIVEYDHLPSGVLTRPINRYCVQKSGALSASFDSDLDPENEPSDVSSKSGFLNKNSADTFGTLRKSLEKTVLQKALKSKLDGQIRTSENECKPLKQNVMFNSKESNVFGNLSETEVMYYPDINEENAKEDNDLSDDSIIVRNLSKRYKCPKKYLQEMKQLVKEKKLKEALDLFLDMRRNFVIPLHQHYTFMIGACGRAGFTEMAFKLLRQMTDRGYQPTPATLTGLFNSCAESPFPEFGLKKALMLKEKIETKGWLLTQITYHSMIKAFGKCGDIQMAFQIVDEMAKADVKIDVITYSFLLMSCVANKEAGFTHAIEVWRKMKERNCKPNLFSCNLLLRAARDCDVGPEEVSSLLLQHWSSYSKRPYGLGMKKDLSQKVLQLQNPLKTELVGKSSENECVEMLNSSSTSDSDTFSEESKYLQKSCSEDTAVMKMQNYSTNLLQNRPVDGPQILELVNINTPSDRLALLGGMENFLKFMNKEKIKPDIKTFTLLLESLPPNLQSEEILLSLMDTYKLKPDIGFFNILIKRRNLRKDGSAARKVLLLVNKHGLVPDVITLGVLALGCRTHTQATNFINDMKKLGYCPNIEIIGALLSNACQVLEFQYLKFVLNFMENEEIKPDERLLRKLEETLETTRKNIISLEQGKEVDKLYKQDNLPEKYSQFCSFYEEWLKRMAIETEEHPWLQYRTNIVEKVEHEAV